VKTVQDAIDALCEMQAPEEPGIHIIEVRSDGDTLQNDSLVTLAQLQSVEVICDKPIDPATIKRPVGSLTLEFPVAFAQEGIGGLGFTLPPVAYQPLILDGTERENDTLFAPSGRSAMADEKIFADCGARYPPRSGSG
jgi:hypothetical protein